MISCAVALCDGEVLRQRAARATPAALGPIHHAHMTRLFLVQGSQPFLGRPFFFSLRVLSLLLAGRPFLLRIAPRATPTPFLAGRSFFLLDSHCAARHARPHARTLASAHTDDRRTNDATFGQQAWLTGSLHDGGIRSVRSPLRRPPLLATRIAMPLQCGRP